LTGSARLGLSSGG